MDRVTGRVVIENFNDYVAINFSEIPEELTFIPDYGLDLPMSKIKFRRKLNMKGTFEIETIDNGYVLTIQTEGETRQYFDDDIGYAFDNAINDIQNDIEDKASRKARYLELKKEFE